MLPFFTIATLQKQSVACVNDLIAALANAERTVRVDGRAATHPTARTICSLPSSEIFSVSLKWCSKISLKTSQLV
jgi:hypothetical protein